MRGRESKSTEIGERKLMRREKPRGETTLKEREGRGIKDREQEKEGAGKGGGRRPMGGGKWEEEREGRES